MDENSEFEVYYMSVDEEQGCYAMDVDEVVDCEPQYFIAEEMEVIYFTYIICIDCPVVV